MRWVHRRLEDLLPVPYFHVVLTIPPQLHTWFRRSPRVAYGEIIAAAAEAILAVCRTNLGATPGVICVLHTWTQTLLFHPHVHCIVTGGGLSLDGQAWIASPRGFLVPVRRLSPVFRAKLLERMARHVRPPRTPKQWSVYCKEPMAGPEQVLRYLGPYTHRIAISDWRILKVTAHNVRFSFRNRRSKNRPDKQTLPADRFVARYLLHVVPRRLVRIRYYGLLANAHKATNLARARALLRSPSPPLPQAVDPWRNPIDGPAHPTPADDLRQCPACGLRTLRLVTVLAPEPRAFQPP